MSPAPHDAHDATPNVVPHSEQNFPVAAAPHAGQVDFSFSATAVMGQS
jgi:hypothetical protein